MAILPPDPVYVFRGDMGPVCGLLFRISPYIEHLYAGTESGDIHVWDFKKHRVAFKLKMNDINKGSCICMHNLGDEYLFVQRDDGASVELWTADGSKWIFDKKIDTNYFGDCRSELLSDDLVLLPLANSKVGVFSVKTNAMVYQLNPFKGPMAKSVGRVAAIKNCGMDKNIVLIGYEDGSLAAWDMKEMAVHSWLKTDIRLITITFDKYWMKGIIGNSTNKLEVFQLSKSDQLSKQSNLTLKNAGTSVLASRADSKVFSAGGWDGRIRIFSWKTLRPLAVLDQHRSLIFDINYSTEKVEAYNNKTLMAVSSKDGTISLWDLYNQ